MDKEVLKEIEFARKEAINEMLQDMGFAKSIEEEELNNKKQKERMSKAIKIGFGTLIFPVTIAKKIRYEMLKKEEKYYREKIAEILSKKENLVNNA